MVKFDGAYFETSYNAEIARKDKLRAQASVPLGIAFVTASTLIFASDQTTSRIGLAFIAFSALGLAAFAINLFRFYFIKPDDPRVPYLDELKEYRESLQAEASVDLAMEAALDQYHFEGASQIARENDRRANRLYRMNQFVAGALVAAVIAAAIPVTAQLLVSTKVMTDVKGFDASSPASTTPASTSTRPSTDADGERFSGREIQEVNK